MVENEIEADEWCSLCETEGSVELVTKTRAFLNSKEQSFLVERLVYQYCTACDESYIDSVVAEINTLKVLRARMLSESVED